jgi:class 3 adenylate cyclase
MTFEEIVDRAVELLRRRGRVTYRTLKRQFDLDDEALDDLKHELMTGLRVATDEEGEVLVWAGAAAGPPPSPEARSHASASRPEASSQVTQSGHHRVASTESGHHRSSATESQIAAERAERRQITVMFCDLVGSTELALKLDPEDLRDVVRAYQSACDDAIRGLGGYVAQYLGDGILAYFGWPVALEDAAERAVRASLASIIAVSRAGTPVSRTLGVRLSMRVGLHTGVVVVGEVGAGEGRQNLAMGEAPNVAARVQGVAEPDTIVLTETTQKLVASKLELLDIGAHKLKGVSGEVRLFRVLGERTERARDDVKAIVGRDHELALFRSVLQTAARGRGGVVLVRGEAGIGKSRLTRAAREMAAEGFAYVSYRCSPYHANTALHPVVDQLERRLGMTRDAPAVERLALLRASLAATTLQLDRSLPLMAQLLSLPVPGLASAQAPARQKALTLEVLAAWCAEDAKKQPVLAIWEDIHWADASTLDLLSMLVASAPKLPIVHLVTYRPGMDPPFRGAPSVQEISLNRFSAADADVLVRQLLGGKRMSPEVLAQVAEKTDGVPLFIEEVTKVLLETGALVEKNGVLEPRGSLGALTVPTTLHDSLMARLDRMSSAREIAQLGAMLGREFSLDLLQAIAPVDELALRESLKQLVDAEILFVPEDGGRYVFKHALIQDVAYQSLLRTTRQRHHERIARVLEAEFAIVAERQPEVVAHHFGAAGMPQQAMAYHRRAGERSVAQSAYTEALAHLSRALEDLALLPPSSERDRDELDLQILRGVPLTATRGYGAPEVLESYARARQLADATGESTKLFPSLYGLWRSSLLRAEYPAGLEVGEQLVGMAQRLSDLTFEIAARRSVGSVRFYLGDYEECIGNMQWVISAAMTAEEVRRRSVSYEVVDSHVTAHSYLGWATWMLGDPVRGCRESDRAVDMAHQLGHGFTRALALSFASWLHQFRRDVPTTRHRVTQALSISAEKGLEMWLGWGTVIQGWTWLEEGRPGLAVDTIRKGIDGWRATGSELGSSYFCTLLADAEGKNGDPHAGLKVLDEAARFSGRTRERFFASETMRVRGELLARAGADESTVREALLAAGVEARERKARMLAVRAASSLVRCLGKPHLPALQAALSELPPDCRERDATEATALMSG